VKKVFFVVLGNFFRLKLLLGGEENIKFWLGKGVLVSGGGFLGKEIHL
jgi:hypothetical protein